MGTDFYPIPFCLALTLFTFTGAATHDYFTERTNRKQIAVVIGAELVLLGLCGIWWVISEQRRPSPPPMLDKNTITFSHTFTRDFNYFIAVPQEGRPADGTFKAGTRFRLIEVTENYLWVETENGMKAYAVLVDN